ncbi:MAG TPA: C_GCAxxG_C_C family protein [Firmicutes bacterium]|nr:C_GCAxxG_C_C family protein [Bacillota bacterium]
MERLEDIQKQVHAKREAGFNCAEGVFWGAAKYLGLEVPVSCVTGFGGGVAGSGSVCGALCGAIAAAGIYVGRATVEDKAGKAKCSELSRAIAEGFEAEMGTRLCREILGYLPGTQKAKTRGINPKCQKAVMVAVELAVKEIMGDQALKQA